MSPFWKPFFAIEDPKHNWAQKRPLYFTPLNSSAAERARTEAERQLAKAQERVDEFGCGFFVAELGIEGDGDTSARVAGVQRTIDICAERGYGWCLWAYGDWADGYEQYGKNLTFSGTYPSIVGSARAP